MPQQVLADVMSDPTGLRENFRAAERVSDYGLLLCSLFSVYNRRVGAGVPGRSKIVR
jgi:hypothetical protein